MEVIRRHAEHTLLQRFRLAVYPDICRKSGPMDTFYHTTEFPFRPAECQWQWNFYSKFERMAVRSFCIARIRCKTNTAADATAMKKKNNELV